MGTYDDMGTGDIGGSYGGGEYLRHPFQGVLEIVGVEENNPERGGIKSLFVHFEVIESCNPETHPVGGKVKWQQKLAPFDMFRKNVGRLLGAVAGHTDPEEIRTKVQPGMGKTLQDAVDSPDDNAMVCTRVRCEMRPHTTQAKLEISLATFLPEA